MSLQTNPQLELARQYVQFTNKNIYLTGKAGTGKTTFLHQIKRETNKRMAVVAPTGVAAINAGGVTIHSLFQLPFGPIIPGQPTDASRQRKFTREKINLIRSLDLLVIDEISMVRADVLDAVDEVLRRYKNPYQPFGGLQLLMIGDLHQLPPVVKEEEWGLLREHYQTAYFFGSHALQKNPPVNIELTHIFRQADEKFIGLLNRVRDNHIDQEVLDLLNSRYIPNFQPDDEAGYITLSTHNASSQSINARHLSALTKPTVTFRANVEGDFPAYSFPTDELLDLKVGAQVMFVKNDISRDKLYYNGKIGKIVRFDRDTIYVKCPADYAEIPVVRVEWKNLKYSLDESTKEVKEEELGKFVQYPLKLAWAITIHKSQGLTFEKAIIDANAAFAHGQVYVALSRCKTFEGLVLSSKIVSNSIKTDSVVRDFTREADRNAPDEQHLEQSKRAFQQETLLDLFNFKPLDHLFQRVQRVFLEHENSLQPGILERFRDIERAAYRDIMEMGDRFRPQLWQYFEATTLPEEHPELQLRLQKAGAYFSEKLSEVCLEPLKKFAIATDNKAVRQSAIEVMTNLKSAIFITKAAFDSLKQSFSVVNFLKAKTNAALEAAMGQLPVATTISETTPVETTDTEVEMDLSYLENVKLYSILKTWRSEKALEKSVPAFSILQNRVLFDLVRQLPTDLLALKNIKGIGKLKANEFGVEILLLIRQYCASQGIEKGEAAMLDVLEKVEGEVSVKLLKKKEIKPDTKLVTFEMFQSGKTIEEIATERGFVISTIEGHLAHFVGKGLLTIEEVLPSESSLALLDYLTQNTEATAAEVKAYFEDKFSYGQIKMAQQHLEWKRSTGE